MAADQSSAQRLEHAVDYEERPFTWIERFFQKYARDWLEPRVTHRDVKSSGSAARRGLKGESWNAKTPQRSRCIRSRGTKRRLGLPS